MRRTGFDEMNPSSVASDITLWSIPMMLLTLFPVGPSATRRRRNSFTQATSTSRGENRRTLARDDAGWSRRKSARTGFHLLQRREAEDGHPGHGFHAVGL